VPPEVYVVLCRGYNDWLSQECTAADRDRRLGLAILPATSVEDQVAELRRVAGMPGTRCVVLHTWPNGSPVPRAELDDQFWAVAVELGTPLTSHITFGEGAAVEAAASAARAPGTWRL
jgi:hypothetical protein